MDEYDVRLTGTCERVEREADEGQETRDVIELRLDAHHELETGREQHHVVRDEGGDCVAVFGFVKLSFFEIDHDHHTHVGSRHAPAQRCTELAETAVAAVICLAEVRRDHLFRQRHERIVVGILDRSRLWTNF